MSDENSNTDYLSPSHVTVGTIESVELLTVLTIILVEVD